MKCKKCGTEVSNESRFCAVCGAKVEPETVAVRSVNAQPNVSAIWPEWQIEKQIGKGSYGVVYQAVRRDNNVESHAAIKVISIPTDSSEVDSLRSEGVDVDGTRTYFKGIVDDFVREIQLMETLKGIQNIVSVEDYKVIERTDSIGWDIYIRMELLTPFNTYIRDRKMTEKEVIKLGCDICTALEICSKRNIIHRDIKPENIFINDFGYFKLGDFGIARKLENMTGGLSQKGTYNYMAPEVANGNTYGASVDTYSLGIVLYRLLNENRLPFLETEQQVLNPNERKNAVERRIKGEKLPKPCNASEQMASLLERACSYNPEQRFKSAEEMKQALISVSQGKYVAVKIDDESIEGATVSVRTKDVVEVPDGNFYVDGKIPTNAPKKKKKGKIIAISILLLIVAIAITLVVVFFTSPAYSVSGSMKSGDFDDALYEYKKDVKNKFIQETILDKLLGERVDEVATEYKNGSIDYEAAIAELDALDQMGFDGAKAKIDEITASNDAVNAFEKADEYYENGDYEGAIEELSKIPEGSENYDEAQTKLTQVYSEYIDSVVAQIKKYNSQKKYKEAVQYAGIAYDVLPDNIDTSKIDTERESALSEYKTQVANEVTDLIDDENYSKAFNVIDEAIEFDDDEYFVELRASTEEKYVESVRTTVQKHLDNENYISAKRVVDNALTVLPDNADLEELKQEVEDNTPTYLLDVCKPYESLRTYKEFINGESFKMGGTNFTNGFQFSDVGTLSAGNGEASFNLNGEYTKLSFYLGTVDGMGAVTNNLLIYYDGVLQTEYTIVGGELPKKYTIDVTGVKQLTFLINGKINGCTYGFGNVTVQ